MWLTADGNPPRGSYTPTPAGGYPAIIYLPEQLLHGVPADLIQMYEAVAFPKFFLVVSGGNGAVMKTHGLIREAIGSFINIDPSGFTLGTPPTAANGTSSSLWLAADIPDHLAQAIVDTPVISSTSITLYPLPYNMPVVGFVGVFAGFTLPNSDAGAAAARDLIRTAIEANGEISQFVQTHRDAFGPQVSVGQAWDMFLASVAVHASPGGSARPPPPSPRLRRRAAPPRPRPRSKCGSTPLWALAALMHALATGVAKVPLTPRAAMMGRGRKAGTSKARGNAASTTTSFNCLLPTY
ncbi:hypothetical protein FB451DRAFT_1223103 [Mycena latifolia]|nr:hypothetical protein FB451DRAFT_1223103 [Mycena latifolia]